MSQLLLNRGTLYRRNLLRRMLPDIGFGPYFLLISLVLFVVLVTIITLTFSTKQVTKGYVLDSLEIQNQELIKENEIRDMEISKVRSLNFIENSEKVKKMRKAPQIVFVTGNTAIASR